MFINKSNLFKLIYFLDSVMISIINLLQQRKASRAFSSELLAKECIDKLMNAAQLSASCFNNQPWRFLFLNEKAVLEKARRALSKGNSWAKEAPLLIIGFSKPDLDCQMHDGREYYLFDLGMAVQNILLQATELNLVARPMAGFSPDMIRNEFDIPKEFKIIVMIAVGFEGDINKLDEKLQKISTAPRNRKPISENFFMNSIK